MWVEKYRPEKLGDIVGQKDVIGSLEALLKKPNQMPHLMFSGSAGLGKTTTGLCIAKQVLGKSWKDSTLELNASDERGIDMVREIISIPRWAALILENEKHCTIQETNMIVELKQALGKENALNEYELSTLEDEFYIKLNAYIERLDKDEQKEAKDLLNTLFRTRHGKLIRLADSSPLTADLSKRMTVEEKLYHDKIHSESKNFTSRIMGDHK